MSKKICSRVLIFITAVSILMPLFVWAQEKSHFYRANMSYEDGNYQHAIDEYQNLLDQGSESGNIYYNLGNCYFKAGQLGKAILNYEKARRLIPRDRDLRSNYQYALSQIKGSQSEGKTNWIVKVFHTVFEQFSIDEITIFLALLYAVAVIAAITGLYIKSFRKYVVTATVFLVFMFIAGLFAFLSKNAEFGKEGVLVSEKADVKFEPFERATTHFTIYEGMKVSVLDSKGQWLRIKRLDGKAGWIDKQDLEVF